MMALIGGLILNLMPCVLPVLGMKLGSILLVEEKAALTSGDNFGFGRRYHCVIYGAGGVMTLLRLSNHALARESSSRMYGLLVLWRW